MMMCGPSSCALESCTAESWERGRDLPGSATACRWRRARWFGSSPGWERTPNQEKLTGEEGLAPNWRVWHRESSGAPTPSRYSQESDYRTESLPLNTHTNTAVPTIEDSLTVESIFWWDSSIVPLGRLSNGTEDVEMTNGIACDFLLCRMVATDQPKALRITAKTAKRSVRKTI